MAFVVSSQNLYRHFDANGVLLYVGISINAVNRLSQHKDVSSWFNDISSVTIEKFNTREEVLEAEKIAIRKENPIHNIKRMPEKVKQDIFNFSKQKKDDSKIELLKSVVCFHPIYSIIDASKTLGLSTGKIKNFIDNNQIGHILIGSRKYITGWQLLTFIESLEYESLYKIPAIQNTPCHVASAMGGIWDE